MRKLRFLAWVVLAAYLLLTLYVITWVRARYHRGGPISPGEARALVSPLREFIMPVRRTLDRFGLRTGDTVLELGPGPGYYTPEASRMVGPSGRVLCLDLQPEMLAMLRPRLEERGVGNAFPVAADALRLPLADASVDAAFLVTVLGEIPDRPGALRELHRVLKPDGALSFTETLTDPDYVSQRTLRDLCLTAGFEESGCWPEFAGYTMSFRRV